MSCISCNKHICSCSSTPNAKEFIQMVLDADSEKLITNKLKPIEAKVNDVIQQNENLVFINREVTQAITDINEVRETKEELEANIVISNQAIADNTATINGLVADVEKQVGDAILKSGYVILDSFETGNTIYQRNEVLKHELTGKIYRWAGKLPKVVPVGSTPESSGSIGTNAWLEVSDTVLRQELSNSGLLGAGAENIAKNRIIYFEDVVSDTTGLTDVTAEMQTLLDSHDGDIQAKPTSVFKTSNTLFNRKSNRTVDFKGAKIVNKSGSRYAIVTISPSFVGTTDLELNTFCTERHYGGEVRHSHITNLRYEMSSNANGGNNLGVGIIYGFKCTADNVQCLSTNGNGFEIRNSLQCGLYNSEIQGHRNYTCFVFMSQRCEIVGNTFKGGSRGVCTKMNRDGDSDCSHVIALNTFQDATSNGRAIIGGEWREKVLTHEIYVAGHEWVDGNKVYGNTFINTLKPQTISMCIFSRNWKVYDNVFKWNGLSGTVINLGGEGNSVEGEALGGGHEIYDNYIYDYNAFDNALISASLSNKTYNNHFINCKALRWYLAKADIAGNSIDYAHFTGNSFEGTANVVASALSGKQGFVAEEGVVGFKFTGNTGLINGVKNGTYEQLIMVYSAAANTQYSGNTMEIVVSPDITTTYNLYIKAGVVKELSNNHMKIDSSSIVVGVQLMSGVEVTAKHEGNIYELIGSPTTARAVSTDADFTDGENTYIGAWTGKVFSLTLNALINTNRERQATFLPIRGAYEKGDFVRNTNPVIVTGSVVFGWLRLTSGSAHVLGTDWIEIKQTITTEVEPQLPAE